VHFVNVDVGFAALRVSCCGRVVGDCGQLRKSLSVNITYCRKTTSAVLLMGLFFGIVCTSQCNSSSTPVASSLVMVASQTSDVTKTVSNCGSDSKLLQM